MAMKRCPVCGEKYSDTYKDCPFCEEDALWEDDEELPGRGGHRGGNGKINLMTPTLVVLIVLMAGVLVWLLYGDKLADRFGKDRDSSPGVSDVTPQEPDPTNPDTPPAGDSDITGADGENNGEGGGNDGTMPEGPVDAGASGGAGNPDGGGSGSYASLAKLPNGLTVSNPDFTRQVSEGTYRLRVSGGSGTYTWVSENPAIATVDSNGVVTPIANGVVNILVSDGSKKAVSIVRVKDGGSPASGGNSTTSSGGNSSTGSSGGSLKAGSAVVINAGNGVRVRSGPGTSYEALATITNGGDVRIVESAGSGWYKITFKAVDGTTTTGYMKGEFLSNS